ncbi:amidohydrolase family protein [Aestuariicoccus sp. MJ-SS9]|uniref:amidohydrolase family protein n=1 Tax=Aestuariicoccus sp. MJ-SS9 TaxID=3079855 RepID=UPI00290A3F9F|nr:amidohydrolase family protein [Aestuariicoccus sp. MJ-SS9]MDU8913923.1 amidohydrolase family protein [Aestuariicoccus sp. MJ-SS9]
MTGLLIRHATALTVDADRRVIEDSAIAVAGDRISAIGPDADLAHLAESADEVIDARGMVALPGLIDCHSHAGHGLIRALGAGDVQAWFGACQALYAGGTDVGFWAAEARLSLLERLMGGVTTCVTLLGGGADIYRTDDPAYGDAHCAATRDSGLRTMLAVGPGRPPFPQSYGAETPVTFERQLEVSAELIARHNDLLDRRTGICLVMPVYGRADRGEVPMPELRRMTDAVGALRERHGVMLTQDGHRDGTIAFARDLGLLGPHALLSHSVDLTAEDIAALEDTGAAVAHNPSAIMSILGRCPVPELIERGVTVALGSDAAAPDRGYDMFRHMAQAMHYHRRHFADPSVLPPGKALEMATIDAARALGLEADLGSLETGKKADIVLVDMRKPHLTPPDMPLHAVTHFANAADVDSLIVDGRVVLCNRVSQTLDPETVMAEAADCARRAIDAAGLALLRHEHEGLWRTARNPKGRRPS